MLEGGRLSEAQLVTMLMYTVLGTAYFFLPAIATNFAGRDAWLGTVTATLAGLVTALATGCLGRRFPGFNFFQWTEILLGRTGGKILQFVYILGLIHLTTIIINEFVYFVNIAFMPNTPQVVFTVLLLLLTGVAAYGGVEMLGRLATVYLPISVAMSMGLIVLAAGLYDPANLMPVLETGWKSLVAGTAAPAGYRSEIFLGAMLFPFLARPANGGRVLVRADIWVGFLLLLDTLSVTLAFGDEAGRLALPVFSLAREINLIHFFQHLESLVLIMWFAGIFVKVAVWQYVTVLGTAQWLNLASYRPLVLPIGLLMAALTNYDLPDVALLVHFLGTVLPFYLMLYTLVIPLALAVVALLGYRAPVSGAGSREPPRLRP